MKVLYIANGLVGTPLNYRGFMPQYNGAIIQKGELMAEICFKTKEVFCYFKVGSGVLTVSTNGTKTTMRAIRVKETRNLPEVANLILAKKYAEELFSAVEKIDFFNKTNVEKFLHFIQAQGA